MSFLLSHCTRRSQLTSHVARRYFARIAKVFPPAQIRALREDDKPSTSAEPATAFDDYSSVCHRIGTDMSIDLAEARKQDDPDDYLYTVQLSDDQQKFEGSFMEVKAKSLRSVA